MATGGRLAGAACSQAEAPKPGDPSRESPARRPVLRVAAQGRAGRRARQCVRRVLP